MSILGEKKATSAHCVQPTYVAFIIGVRSRLTFHEDGTTKVLMGKPVCCGVLCNDGQAVVQKIPSQSHRIAGQETLTRLCPILNLVLCDLDGRDANDKRIPFSQCTFFKMMQVLKSSLGFLYTSSTGTSMFLSQIGQHIFSIHDGDVPCNLI